MTSRRERQGRCSAGEFEGLIRWALQERVVGRCPPPGMGERICALAKRRRLWFAMGRGFRKGYWTLVGGLFDVDAHLSALMDSWLRPQGKWEEWRFDPRFTCLVDQYSFLFQLAF